MFRIPSCHEVLAPFALGTLVLLLPGCGLHSSRADSNEKARPRPAVVSDIDAGEINDTAKFLAGMPGRDDGPYHELEATPAWQSYHSNFDKTWARVNERQFKPVAEFEKRELADGSGASKFVFYPFSGPDVLYMTSFFPGRETYVMAGLERVGHLPRVGEYKAINIDAHLQAWNTAMASIFRRSFFVTSEMSAQLGGEVSDGLLPIIVLLLERRGYTIDGVRMGQIGADGSWGPPPTDRRVRAVRVDFHTGDADEQTLYYLSNNFATAFGPNAPIPAFLDRLGKPEVFLKSASYLAHRVEFVNFRDYVLRVSTRFLQDDTGIPYQALVDGGWKVKLYGKYSHPDAPFRPRFQPALDAAFAQPGQAGELGFSIGYGFHERTSSLQIATR